MDHGLQLLGQVVRGRISRREALKRGVALGMSIPALGALGMVAPERAGAQGGDPTGEIVWALSSPPPNLLPFGALSLAHWQAREFLYDSLVYWDENLQVHGAVAETWETPDDQTYVFNIRQGVTFHDGQPLTAKDVKYSLDLAKAPPEPGSTVPFLANVDTVEVVDDFTVKVNMTKADPTIVGFLAWGGYTPIVPEGIYDRINVLSEGIGSGPFKLVEYVQDDVIVYEAYEGYWNPDVPCVQKLTLKTLTDEQSRVAALRSGEIHGGDFSADVVMTLENDPNLEVLSGLTSSTRVIHFNTVEDVPWRDVRVRQAINKVVDRQKIIDNVYGGKAELTNAIPPGYGDYPLSNERLQELYAVDVEGAKALMEEAGFADGFEVTLQAIAAPRDYVQIAEIVQEACKQINITVTVEPLEIGQFAENIGSGSFQWASTARGMRGDPSGYVIDFRNGTGLNVKWFGEGWKSDEFDALYDEALATVDQSARPALYQQMLEIIATDAVNLYTVQPYKYQVVDKSLTGMFVFFGNTNPGLRTACVEGE
jgi:peptide/nickel transport system substrate-binding protein